MFMSRSTNEFDIVTIEASLADTLNNKFKTPTLRK